MKKTTYIFIAIFVVVGLFFIIKRFDMIYTDKEESKANWEIKSQTKSLVIGNNNPEMLTFIIQPSLNENVEVIINFEKNYLFFRNIYPFSPEPPPPTKKDGTHEEFVETRKSLKPYFAKLQNEDLRDLKMIIDKISAKDFERIEGTYIDGTSYNFSILYSGNNLKNGFIANEKTENQKELVLEILNLLQKTNTFEENQSILSYYFKHY